ncbi:MAG: hypothetical protein M1444_03055 [Patescibacteria group bacterium]|nr:hypothetical protein [Patescibacteria group bacterium]
MANIEHPKTGVIREIVELGHSVYGRLSFRMEMDKPSCELNGETPRALINKGQSERALRVLTTAFESQRI